MTVTWAATLAADAPLQLRERQRRGIAPGEDFAVEHRAVLGDGAQLEGARGKRARHRG